MKVLEVCAETQISMGTNNTREANIAQKIMGIVSTEIAVIIGGGVCELLNLL